MPTSRRTRATLAACVCAAGRASAELVVIAGALAGLSVPAPRYALSPALPAPEGPLLASAAADWDASSCPPVYVGARALEGALVVLVDKAPRCSVEAYVKACRAERCAALLLYSSEAERRAHVVPGKDARAFDAADERAPISTPIAASITSAAAAPLVRALLAGERARGVLHDDGLSAWADLFDGARWGGVRALVLLQTAELAELAACRLYAYTRPAAGAPDVPPLAPLVLLLELTRAAATLTSWGADPHGGHGALSTEARAALGAVADTLGPLAAALFLVLFAREAQRARGAPLALARAPCATALVLCVCAACALRVAACAQLHWAAAAPAPAAAALPAACAALLWCALLGLGGRAYARARAEASRGPPRPRALRALLARMRASLAWGCVGLCAQLALAAGGACAPGALPALALLAGTGGARAGYARADALCPPHARAPRGPLRWARESTWACLRALCARAAEWAAEGDDDDDEEEGGGSGSGGGSGRASARKPLARRDGALPRAQPAAAPRAPRAPRAGRARRAPRAAAPPGGGGGGRAAAAAAPGDARADGRARALEAVRWSLGAHELPAHTLLGVSAAFIAEWAVAHDATAGTTLGDVVRGLGLKEKQRVARQRALGRGARELRAGGGRHCVDAELCAQLSLAEVYCGARTLDGGAAVGPATHVLLCAHEAALLDVAYAASALGGAARVWLAAFCARQPPSGETASELDAHRTLLVARRVGRAALLLDEWDGAGHAAPPRPLRRLWVCAELAQCARAGARLELLPTRAARPHLDAQLAAGGDAALQAARARLCAVDALAAACETAEDARLAWRVARRALDEPPHAGVDARTDAAPPAAADARAEPAPARAPAPAQNAAPGAAASVAASVALLGPPGYTPQPREPPEPQPEPEPAELAPRLDACVRAALCGALERYRAALLDGSGPPDEVDEADSGSSDAAALASGQHRPLALDDSDRFGALLRRLAARRRSPIDSV